jgi:hypothetical protein
MDYTKIREQLADCNNVFQHTKINARVGEDYADFQPKPCSTPTKKIPGTPDRIAVYCERIERGEELWHEDDCCLELPEMKNGDDIWRRWLTGAIRRSRHYGNQ